MLLKRQHYDLAVEHLDSQDDARLPYAALEFRMCLESIVYEKLRVYERRLPEKIKKKWQPDQALRALVALEPEAEQSHRLLMAREVESGVPAEDWHHVTTHVAVKATWVRKAYNKLGSYVHESQPFTSPKYPYRVGLQKTREALESMAAELKDAAYSGMGAAIAMVLSFECCACGSPVVCNEAALKDGARVDCLDPDCEATHVASKDEKGWSFQPTVLSFSCARCSASTPVDSASLRVGLRKACRECKVVHRLAWAFVPEETEAGEDVS